MVWVKRKIDGETQAAEYTRDAYGNTQIFDDQSERTYNPKCQFIFTDRRFDPETSNATTQMYFYRARYYSPVLGRFISRDPGPRAEDGPGRIAAGPAIEGGFVPRDTPYLRPDQVDAPQPSGAIPWKYESLGLEVSSGLIGDHHRAISPARINPYADGMSLYQYCRSNPVVLTDPNGELSGYVIAALACAQLFVKEVKKKFHKPSDDLLHCWVSCKMSRICGGTLTALAGLGKEVKDSVKRILNQMEGGTGDWADSLMDMVANNKCVGLESFLGHAGGWIGGWIGSWFRESCECCCKRHYK